MRDIADDPIVRCLERSGYPPWVMRKNGAESFPLRGKWRAAPMGASRSTDNPYRPFGAPPPEGEALDAGR